MSNVIKPPVETNNEVVFRAPKEDTPAGTYRVRIAGQYENKEIPHLQLWESESGKLYLKARFEHTGEFAAKYRQVLSGPIMFTGTTSNGDLLYNYASNAGGLFKALGLEAAPELQENGVVTMQNGEALKSKTGTPVKWVIPVIDGTPIDILSQEILVKVDIEVGKDGKSRSIVSTFLDEASANS